MWYAELQANFKHCLLQTILHVFLLLIFVWNKIFSSKNLFYSSLSLALHLFDFFLHLIYICLQLVFSKFDSKNLLLNCSATLKVSNLQFHWNLQLCHFLFRNVPCYSANILTVEANRIYVVLNSSGATRSIALNILNVF